MIGLGLDLSLKWRPTGGLDPLVSAFKAESGATDVTGLNNLIKYVRSEGLIDNFVIYPMKADQNAGSGATVYSLGGLTTNDMTLVNAPTWGASGITYNGTTQYGSIVDFLASETLTCFSCLSLTDATPIPDQCIAANDTGTSRALYTFVLSSGALRLLRSSDGTAGAIEAYDTAISTATTDETCYVSQWTNGGGRAFWLNKTSKSLTLSGGSAQTTVFNTAEPFQFAARAGSSLMDGLGKTQAFLTGSVTTTQRETITDFINAL